MATIADLLVKLGIDARDYKEGLEDAEEKTEQSSKGISKSLGGLGGVLQGAFSFVTGNLLTKGIDALAGAMGGLKAGLIDGNAEFERYETQFGVLLGSTDAAQERLAKLADFGAKTPFELPDVVKADKILQGFGLHSEESAKKFGKSGEEILRIAGDVSSGTGAGFDEMSLLLGKFSAGATGEAISRMAELGIASREDLKKMGLEFDKSGALLSPLPEAMTAVLQLMDNKYGGMMDKQSGTFEGMLSNLEDWKGQTLRKLGEPIFEVMKDKLGSVLTFLSSPAVQTAINSVADGIANGIGLAIDSMGKAIDWLTPYISSLITWVTNLAGSVGSGGNIQSALDGLQTKFTQVWAVIQNVINTVLPPIQTIITTVFQAIRDFWAQNGTDIVNTAQDVWNKVLSIINLVVAIVGPILQAIAKFISEHGDRITAVFTGAWNAIKIAVETVLGVVQGILSAVLKAMHGDWAGAWEDIKKVGETLWNGILGIITTAINTLANVVFGGLEQAKTWFTDKWNAITSFLRGIDLGAIGMNIINSLKNGLASIGSGLRDFITGKWEEVVSFLRNINLGSIGHDAIMGFWEGLKGAWNWLVGAFQDLVNFLPWTIRHLLGIASPSKVFESLGVMTALGLERGITKGSKGVLSAVANLSEGLISGGRYHLYTGGDRGANPSTPGSVYNLTINSSANPEPMLQDWQILQTLAGA